MLATRFPGEAAFAVKLPNPFLRPLTLPAEAIVALNSLSIEAFWVVLNAN